MTVTGHRADPVAIVLATAQVLPVAGAGPAITVGYTKKIDASTSDPNTTGLFGAFLTPVNQLKGLPTILPNGNYVFKGELDLTVQVDSALNLWLQAGSAEADFNSPSSVPGLPGNYYEVGVIAKPIAPPPQRPLLAPEPSSLVISGIGMSVLLGGAVIRAVAARKRSGEARRRPSTLTDRGRDHALIRRW
jgi:hypothetical protein